MYILLTFFLFVCSMEEWNMNGQSLWSSGDCGLIRQIQIQWKMKSHNPLTEEWLLFLLRKVDLTSSHSLSIILICVRRRLIVTNKKTAKLKKVWGIVLHFLYMYLIVFLVKHVNINDNLLSMLAWWPLYIEAVHLWYLSLFFY